MKIYKDLNNNLGKDPFKDICKAIKNLGKLLLDP